MLLRYLLLSCNFCFPTLIAVSSYGPFGKMNSGFNVQKFTYVYPQYIVLILKYFKSSHYILVNTTATVT